MKKLGSLFAASVLVLTAGTALAIEADEINLGWICTDKPAPTTLTKQETIDLIREVTALAGKAPAVEEHDVGSRSFLKFAFPADNLTYHMVLDREARLNCTISAETFERFRPG